MKIKKTGFTLIEAMMALVILSIAAAGLLLPFAASATVQEEGNNRTLAVKLGSDLMEEIVDTDFDQIISSYGSYSESAGSLGWADGSGNMAGDLYSGFSRTAECQYVYTAQQDGLDTPNFIRITVKVFYKGSQMAELVRLKSE